VEIVDAGMGFGKEGGRDGAGGESFPGEGFVLQGQPVAARKEGDRVDAGDFPLADGGDFRFLAEGVGDDGAEGLGRPGRRVQLVDVVDLFDGRGVVARLEDFGGAPPPGACGFLLPSSLAPLTSHL